MFRKTEEEKFDAAAAALAELVKWQDILIFDDADDGAADEDDEVGYDDCDLW